MLVWISLGVAALFAVLFGAIFRKMGFSPFSGILAVIPFVNRFWWLYLATSDWPIELELAERPEPDERPQEDHLTLMFKRAEMFENRGGSGSSLFCR